MIYLHPATLEMLKGARIVSDKHVSDTHMVRRSLKERLFTTPWTPLAKYRPVYCPSAYILADGTIVVSPRTYKILASR